MFEKESKIELDIYIDEIEPEHNCNYIILGALFVPRDNKDKIFAEIFNIRCQNDQYDKWHDDFNSCPFKERCKKEWHDMDNCEIHFTDIREGRVNRSMIKISKSWLKNYCDNNQKYFTNVLYISLDNLDVSFFGDSSINSNIYNKFLRTLINYGLKCFFSIYDKIIIKNIFYDEKTDLERHYFFNSSNLSKIAYESSKNIIFENKVIFLKSDHKEEEKYPEESHFIQLIDIIIGSIRHNLFRISESDNKDDVARIIRPLLNKIRQEYFCSDKLKVSFFPKNRIQTITDLKNEETYQRNDEFYYLDSFNFKMSEQSTTLGAWM